MQASLQEQRAGQCRTAEAFPGSFARAGHGHAGVLVILSLVTLLHVDATDLPCIARLGEPVAEGVMSGGLFASSAGKNVTKPNKFIWVLWIGALSHAAVSVAAADRLTKQCQTGVRRTAH